MGHILSQKEKDRLSMSEENGRDLKLTEFDYMMADPHLQMMKAAIPYLQPPQQRIISMMIKIQEVHQEIWETKDQSTLKKKMKTSTETSK